MKGEPKNSLYRSLTNNDSNGYFRRVIECTEIPFLKILALGKQLGSSGNTDCASVETSRAYLVCEVKTLCVLRRI